MRLALRELVRRPGKFAAATLILFLIAGLLLFLGGLSNGLNGGIDGAVRSQSGDLVVFGREAQRSVPQSLVTAEQRAAVAATDGVAAVGGLTVTQLAARLPDRDGRDLVDVAVFGYERPFGDLPADPAPGTAWADRRLAELGVEEGMTLLVGPARTPLTVQGFVSGAAYVGQGTLWIGAAALTDLVAAGKPDEVLPPGASQVLVVEVAEGADVAAVAAAVDAATGATESLTVTAAADAIPDVDGGTLRSIVGMTVVIAAAVVALFFALLTNERLGLYAVLKAVGARSRTLAAGVVVQAVVLTSLGVVVALAAATAFDRLVPAGEIPFSLTAGGVLAAVGLLLTASVLGALASLRRVVRTDPASAIGSAA